MKQISGERLQDHWSSGLYFAQNIDRRYMLEPPRQNCLSEAVLVSTGTHNLCFGPKIRKIGISLLVLCRLIEIIDNYRNLASIGSYRLEFSTID